MRLGRVGVKDGCLGKENRPAGVPLNEEGQMACEMFTRPNDRKRTELALLLQDALSEHV